MLKAWKGMTWEQLRQARAAYRKLHPEDPKRKKAAGKAYYQKNKDQHLAKGREWAKKNPMRVLAATLRCYYGISLEEFERRLISQCGRCAICEKPMTGVREPMVDHCHNSGKVRGLLCLHCNVVLGMADDSVAVLHRAIEYVKSGGEG